MTPIRAIFDGKAFIPQQPVSLPAQSEALILVDGADQSAQQRLDEAIRGYYQTGDDEEDNAWGRATEPGSRRGWDED